MQKRHAVISLDALTRSAGRVLIVALGTIVASAADAETQVTEQADIIRLEARDAPVTEVLTALGATYELRSHSTTDLGQPLTGTYAGSVREVISRVLAGYDYVVIRSDGGLAVLIYGMSKPTPSAPTQKAAAQNIAHDNVTETKPRPPASATDTAMASSKPASVVAAFPPPPPNSVAAMLGTNALSQIPGNAAAAAPAPVDMAALTQGATSSLQNLVAALNNVPHN